MAETSSSSASPSRVRIPKDAYQGTVAVRRLLSQAKTEAWDRDQWAKSMNQDPAACLEVLGLERKYGTVLDQYDCILSTRRWESGSDHYPMWASNSGESKRDVGLHAIALWSKGDLVANRRVAAKEREVSHLCGSSRCINPDHLEAEDHQTNMDRIQCKRWVEVQIPGQLLPSVVWQCKHDPPCYRHHASYPGLTPQALKERLLERAVPIVYEGHRPEVRTKVVRQATVVEATVSVTAKRKSLTGQRTLEAMIKTKTKNLLN